MSIWDDIVADLKVFVRVIFGLANSVAAGWFLYLDDRSHTTHIAIYVGWIALGLVITWPSVVIGAIKMLVSAVPDSWIPAALKKPAGTP